MIYGHVPLFALEFDLVESWSSENVKKGIFTVYSKRRRIFDNISPCLLNDNFNYYTHLDLSKVKRRGETKKEFKKALLLLSYEKLSYEFLKEKEGFIELTSPFLREHNFYLYCFQIRACDCLIWKRGELVKIVFLPSGHIARLIETMRQYSWNIKERKERIRREMRFGGIIPHSWCYGRTVNWNFKKELYVTLQDYLEGEGDIEQLYEAMTNFFIYGRAKDEVINEVLLSFFNHPRKEIIELALGCARDVIRGYEKISQDVLERVLSLKEDPFYYKRALLVLEDIEQYCDEILK